MLIICLANSDMNGNLEIVHGPIHALVEGISTQIIPYLSIEHLSDFVRGQYKNL